MRTKCVCAALVGVAGTWNAARADTPPIHDARRAVEQMERNNRSLFDVIQAAERQTGGKAIGVKLLSSSDMGQAGYQRGYEDQRGDVRYLVTCLVDRSQLRNVYVDATETRHMGARGTGYYPEQRERYGSQVDRSFIEYHAWPPRPGDRYYDEYATAQYRDDFRGMDRYRYEQRGQYDYDQRPYQARGEFERRPNFVYSQGQYDQYDQYGRGQYDQRQYGQAQFRDYDQRQSFEQMGQMALGSQLIKQDVRGISDEQLGRIDDLALDPQTHRILYVVLRRTGGDSDANLFAVPCEKIDHAGADRVRLSITRSEIEGRRGFESENWPTQADPYWDTGFRGTTSGRLVKGSIVMGGEMKNRQDQDLGDIEDLVIDLNRAKVAYYLVEQDDKRLVAVPCQAVNLEQGGRAQVDLSRDRFKQLESFREGNYPQWNDSQWNQRIHREFNVRPYWEDDFSRTSR